MSAHKWYYELLMEEFGPVPTDQIRQMIAERVLSLSDRVRPESSPDWITIAEMRDAVMAEDDDDDEDLEADEDALDINAFRLEGNSDSPMPDDSRASPDELDINAFQLQGDSDSPLPPARERPVAETTYSVQSLGQVLGPMPHEELLQMARSGALSRGDEVRDDDDGRWLPVEAVPEVAALMARPSAADSASSGSSQAKQAGALKKKRKAATGRPTPKRKRRKKKEDPLLKEIFAEVFTDDGKVRDEMKRSSGAAAPAAATALPTAASVPPADDVGGGTDLATSAAATGNPSPPPPQSPSPSPSPSPAPPLPGSAGAGAAPAPSFHPRPQQAPRKASKSGGGFQMPDPKILGIAGGVLALVLVIVGGVMGIIPLPGFGINAAGFLDDFAAAYPKANSGSASDWAAFKEDFGPKARDVARALAPDVATDPEAKRFQMAALLVVRIVAAAQDDKERQEEMFADFKKVMSGS